MRAMCVLAYISNSASPSSYLVVCLFSFMVFTPVSEPLPASQHNKTKQNRADLRYHPKAGHSSLSLRTVTCWSSYNYSSHPHPSQYCCGVRRAHSLSGSAALHKETITKSKQAPSTKRRGTTEGRT